MSLETFLKQFRVRNRLSKSIRQKLVVYRTTSRSSLKLQQVCGISNALDGTEDDAIYAEEFANAEDEEMDDEFDNDKEEDEQ